MKIKQTLLALTLLFGSVIVLALPSSTYAASCGGVETSVIDCAPTGQCEDGENPYEGIDPGSDAAKQAKYETDHGHKYGLCKYGVEPSTAVSDTGLWGVLLVFINILTAGVGILAVGGVVYGSILYTTAGGSSEQIKKATTAFTNVIIGVIAYAAMYTFLNFIIPGGIFN